MKPMFTVHAGEYLVGSYIEENFKNLNIWVPSRDSGIDLLITNKDNKKTVSIIANVYFILEYLFILSSIEATCRPAAESAFGISLGG